jgi:drug/metabolite transporter (DMT)-like permease
MRSAKTVAIFAAIVSGISVFINSLAVKSVPNAYFFTTAKNVTVAFLFIAILVAVGKWQEVRTLSKKNWLKLIFLGVIGGSVPFLLFFQGLAMSKQAALNGAFIQKTMFIWVAILAIAFFKEKITSMQGIGLAVILWGVVLMGGLRISSFGTGEILVFVATLLWSVEAIFVSKFTEGVSAEVLAFGRMFFGGLIMLCYILMTQKSAVFSVTVFQLEWILLTAGFLVLYVLAFYRSLTNAKATEVTTILTLAFPITIICQSYFTRQPLNSLPSLALVTLGAIIYVFSGYKALWEAAEPNV